MHLQIEENAVYRWIFNNKNSSENRVLPICRLIFLAEFGREIKSLFFSGNPTARNRELCFAKGGLLVREFDEIFSDLFSRRKGIHKELVTCLANGPKDLAQICKELGKSQGGLYSQYLDELVKADFVRRDFTGA